MTPTPQRTEAIVAKLLEAFSDNRWFRNIHWPENAERVSQIVADVVARFPDGGRVLDVGCFNGYVSLLLSWSGYEVTATDMENLEDRTRLFGQHGVTFHPANLNALDPFPFIAPTTLDAVIMGEVIEHVLNYPLGLLRSLAKALKPDGLLILSTPNPSNVMNAARVLMSRPLLWGTDDFVSVPKFDGTNLISRGDIHYREYTTTELRRLLTDAGFEIEKLQYMGMGTSSTQSAIKRWAKKNLLLRSMMSQRLFACTQYLVSRPTHVNHSRS